MEMLFNDLYITPLEYSNIFWLTKMDNRNRKAVGCSRESLFLYDIAESF